MSKKNLVLIHGWGLNEEVWSNISEQLSNHYEVHLLSLPGYGKRHAETPKTTLDALADDLLSQAPESAIWCGWSLGGMAALSAALRKPERFLALNLLCVTPKFVISEDWQQGTDIQTFTKFANDLSTDYKRGIQRFLLLQSGTSGDSKQIAKQAASALNKHPAPSSETLTSGLDILEKSDLRLGLPKLCVPCTVVSGSRDRVVPPQACAYLAHSIPDAGHVELNSGHAPHLSHPEELIALLLSQASESSA